MVLPMRVVLTQSGQDIRPKAQSRGPSPTITLNFASSGSTAYSAGYQAFLQSVYTSAKPLMDSLFGQPASGGTVNVSNFDAESDSRATFFGGYYLVSGTGGTPEIRFPEIANPEAAAAGFIHCLLLAYLGSSGYSYDGYQEGLCRAVTMQIIRDGGLPSSVNAADAKSYLLDQYDVGPIYDWINAPALSANPFLAPNLRNVPLPTSGSTGGIFLLRYQAAGSAFQKVLAKYRFFARDLNAKVKADTTIGQSIAKLNTAGDQVLAAVSANSIEGQTFSNWTKRQSVLNPSTFAGPKVLVAPTPLTTGLSGPDFGVFSLQIFAFTSQANGNENLGLGTLYPVFWDADFLRFRTSTQENAVVLDTGSGNLAPNFPNLYAGQNYRTSIDLAFQDQHHRFYLPAGAIQRAGETSAKNLYGTVTGVLLQTGDTLAVQVTGTGVNLTLPVTRWAFGGTLDATQLANARELRFDVIRTRLGVPTTVYSKFVNRGSDGPLAVSLQADEEGTYTTSAVSPGITMVGLPISGFDPTLTTALGSPSSLLARYDSSSAGYLFGSQLGAQTQGHAYFVNNVAGSSAISVAGRTFDKTPFAVALKPGWNMIANPFNEVLDFTKVQVVHASDDPLSWANAKGDVIGLDIFEFVPGANDPAAGFPQTGTLTAAANFQPRKGYYIRCLLPEGAILLFTPSALGRAVASQEVVTRQTGLKVDAFQGQQTSGVILGEAAGAANTLSSRFDSALPPLMGGLQLASTGKGSNLFRDTRAEGSNSTYTLRLDGLTPGQVTYLRISRLAGPYRKARVQLPGQASRVVKLPWVLSFVPNQKSVNLTVQGVQ